jgi:hypothetical protein
MQLSYGNDPLVGAEGGLADSGYHDVLTYNNPVVEIPFGRGLFKILDDDDGVKLPDSDAPTRFLGVAVRSLTSEVNVYPIKSAISGLAKGRIYVLVEEAVDADDPVYCRFGGKQQVQTITFSADFVALNKINMKINGEPIAEVTFDTDQATTMTALDAAITAMEGVAGVTTLGDVVTITSEQDVTLEITEIAVTLGVSQATSVVAETVVGVPLADRGKFRKSADSATAMLIPSTKARWTTGAAAGTVAVLDVNLP